MDGENNGKPYKNEWFGGKPIIFGNTHMFLSCQSFADNPKSNHVQ